MSVVDRARVDLAEGRPWLARDRLQGALVHQPTGYDLLDLLGQAHYAMGDLPAAGAAWFLSNRSDSEAEVATAISALRSRYRSPVAVAQVLRVRADASRYAAPAAIRLEALANELRATGAYWHPPAPPWRGKPGDRTHPRRRVRIDESDGDTAVDGVIGCTAQLTLLLIVLLLIASMVVGLVVIVRWVF